MDKFRALLMTFTCRYFEALVKGNMQTEVTKDVRNFRLVDFVWNSWEVAVLMAHSGLQ
jgi:hypothetical protein